MPRTKYSKFLASSILAISVAISSGAFAQTIKIVPHTPLLSLDPIWTTAYITRTHGYLVYDTLFGLDAELVAQPQMVGTWEESEDGLNWVFNLRAGLKWHDGSPVTAADCVASLRRWSVRDGTGRAMFEKVERITVTDGDSFTIALSSPYPEMLDSLAQMSSNVPFMMPERIANTNPYIPITDPIGSGPYIFSMRDWDPVNKVVYLRNDAYVPREEPTSLAAGGKVAKLDRIELVYYPDRETAIDALTVNEVQYVESLTLELANQIRDETGVVVTVSAPAGNVGMAVFNHLIPPFDNADIRRAVILAMDQREYMGAALEDADYWWPCPSVYACGTQYSTPYAENILSKTDVEAAKAALQAANYDGTPVVLLNPVDSPVISAFNDVTAELLSEIGMTIDVQDMQWIGLLQRSVIQTPDQGEVWNMFHTWWIADDLSTPTRIVYSGDPVMGWYGWPDDMALEALRAEFRRAENEEDAGRVAAAVQHRILEIGAFATLGQFVEPVAFRDTVIGHQGPIQMYYNLGFME